MLLIQTNHPVGLILHMLKHQTAYNNAQHIKEEVMTCLSSRDMHVPYMGWYTTHGGDSGKVLISISSLLLPRMAIALSSTRLYAWTTVHSLSRPHRIISEVMQQVKPLFTVNQLKMIIENDRCCAMTEPLCHSEMQRMV